MFGQKPSEKQSKNFVKLLVIRSIDDYVIKLLMIGRTDGYVIKLLVIRSTDDYVINDVFLTVRYLTKSEVGTVKHA